jgi:hypothetical protein
VVGSGRNPYKTDVSALKLRKGERCVGDGEDR